MLNKSIVGHDERKEYSNRIFKFTDLLFILLTGTASQSDTRVESQFDEYGDSAEVGICTYAF